MIKVMLIEDDQTMVSLLTTLLDLEGFNVIAPVNHHTNHYLQAILEERPQIVLVDVNLRTSNGLDLVREIRQEPEISEMKILMSSGSNLKDESAEAGADGFILKPFMPDELINKIHSITQSVLTKTR